MKHASMMNLKLKKYMTSFFLGLDLDLERTQGDGNRERGWKERGRAFMNLL